MKVVATERLKEATIRYPAAKSHLLGWYQILSNSDFKNEKALRDTFGDMRGFSHRYRFPVPETTLLVHTLIHFESQVALIHEIKPGTP